MRNNRLIIGVDYGTTFTGVAFCETSDIAIVGKDITVVKDWPSRNKIGTNEKVSSEIAVNDRELWGALIPPGVQRHMWTKLLLDNATVGEVSRIQKELPHRDKPSPTDPVDIIADYLTHVRAHLVKNLNYHYGEELWKSLPITLVITFPAVWSDAAKDATVHAFEKAGFNDSELPQLKRTLLTTEPEAAAIYTMHSLRGGIQDDQFAVGDGFVVCDMGGGTVDLVSYRIAGLEPTILEEATVGAGSQCGGSFVERGFLKWLERRLGRDKFFLIAGTSSDALPRTSLASKMGRLLQDFNLEAKNSFSGSEVNFVRLPMPLGSIEEDKERGIQDGEIEITAAHMKEMFRFSIDRACELILEQIRQSQRGGNIQLKYAFMVGGFSESPYVYETIKAFAEGYGLQVIRPAHAWSAVVRGAVAKGLEGPGRAPVLARKCRRHYGTGYSEYFVYGKHKEDDSFTCRFTGRKLARNQMEWLLTKGQNLSTKAESHARLSFQTDFWPGDSRVESLELLASDAFKAPNHSKDKDIYTVARLNVDLSGVPQKNFVLHTNSSGRLYYTLDYEVELSVQSSLEFCLLVDGIRYGGVEAKYA